MELRDSCSCSYILATLGLVLVGCTGHSKSSGSNGDTDEPSPGDVPDSNASSLITPVCAPGQELPLDTEVEASWFMASGSLEADWVLPAGTGLFLDDNRYIDVQPFEGGIGGLRLTLVELGPNGEATVRHALTLPLYVERKRQGVSWEYSDFDVQVFRLTETRFAVAATQQTISVFDTEENRIQPTGEVDFPLHLTTDTIRSAIGNESTLFICTDIILLRYQVHTDGTLSFVDNTIINNDAFELCSDLAFGPGGQEQEPQLWIATSRGLYTATADIGEEVKPVPTQLRLRMARIERQDDLLFVTERSNVVAGQYGEIKIYRIKSGESTVPGETPAANPDFELLETYSSSSDRRYLGVAATSNGMVLMTSTSHQSGATKLHFETHTRGSDNVFERQSSTQVADLCCGRGFLYPAAYFAPASGGQWVMLQPWRHLYDISVLDKPERVQHPEFGNSPVVFRANVGEQEEPEEIVIALGAGTWRTYESLDYLDSAIALSPCSYGTLPDSSLPTQVVVFGQQGNPIQALLPRDNLDGVALDQVAYDGDGPTRLGCLAVKSEDSSIAYLGDFVIPAPVGRLRFVDGVLYNLVLEEDGHVLQLDKYEIDPANCRGTELRPANTERWPLDEHGPARRSFLRFDVDPSSDQMAVTFTRLGDKPSLLLWQRPSEGGTSEWSSATPPTVPFDVFLENGTVVLAEQDKILLYRREDGDIRQLSVSIHDILPSEHGDEFFGILRLDQNAVYVGATAWPFNGVLVFDTQDLSVVAKYTSWDLPRSVLLTEKQVLIGLTNGIAVGSTPCVSREVAADNGTSAVP